MTEENKAKVKKIAKIIGGLFVLTLVVMQFFRIDRENPALDSSMDFVERYNPPAEVAQILREVCYDCHSHETNYPWYTNVAPLSWWIGEHIEHARKHLNFSRWGEYDREKQLHKIEEVAEEVEEGEMPLSSYTLVHWDANLSDEQREILIKYFEGL